MDGLKTLSSTDAANPLIIGTTLHRGIETDVETAIREYFDSFPIITDQHIDEEIKLRYLIPKVKECLPEGIHEVQVVDTNFIGTLDMLVPVSKALHPELDGDWFDLLDFKYINPKNQDRYADSRQLHLYKYYFEKMNPGKRIRNMSFILVHKVQIRQKKTETIFDFRKRLMEELEQVQITQMFIDYAPQMVIDHLEMTQEIMTCEEYPKNQTRRCDFCDFQRFCESDGKEDWMIYGKT